KLETPLLARLCGTRRLACALWIVEDRLPHGAGEAVEGLAEDHFQAELVELSYSANHTLPVGTIRPLLTSSCWTAKSIFQPIRGLDSFWETGLGLVAA
ncbi:MAG: hypothetical protein ACXVBV_20835, partial [Isosphaeraceae bacterium]